MPPLRCVWTYGCRCTAWRGNGNGTKGRGGAGSSKCVYAPRAGERDDPHRATIVSSHDRRLRDSGILVGGAFAMPRDQHPSSLGLRSIALLDALPAERVDALARECAWRNYVPDQQIISREADDRDLYLIVSGRVRVTTYSAGGRQVTFRDLGAGDCFGDVAAIDGKPRSADVVALESSLLAAMPP